MHNAILNLAAILVNRALNYFCRAAAQFNTALEPTADSAFSLSGSAGFATRQFGGGSAFVR